MMKTIVSIVVFVIGLNSIAQSFPENIDITEIKGIAELSVAFTEKVPVYKGCDETLSNWDLAQCMSERINKHIYQHFNTEVTDGLGLPDGNVKITAFIKIDTTGTISDITIRAPHPALEKETYRVIKLIPTFTRPAYQKGKPVTFPFKIPINFEVYNLKNSKKKRKG